MSRKKSLFLIFLNILCVAAQNFSNAPCLGIATTAGMRGITVKNFGNRTNAALFQKVGLYRCKICHCLFFCFRRVVVDFHVSGQKAAHQKSPCGSLMVSGISFRKRATVDPVIVFVFRREGAYAGAGKQLFLYGIYHLQSLFGREHGMWKADGIDLVGADACIFAVSGLFCFRPIPLSFEPVEPGRCSPVLYSSSIRDMIDYSLRSCVERNITVRRCKNCGRWFPQTGRVSAEYCERPVPKGQQRCRDIGALKQWTLRQAGNDAFKAYRKEYKRRFAWIKAGRITDQQFYDWSERARAEKDKCEQGLISQKELETWLKESK